MTKTWTPNEKQTQFIKDIAEYPNGITLIDLKAAGKVYATGTINTLVNKGLVATADTKIECSIVYNGVVVGKVTKPAKIYKLVQKD